MSHLTLRLTFRGGRLGGCESSLITRNHGVDYEEVWATLRDANDHFFLGRSERHLGTVPLPGRRGQLAVR